MLLVRHKSFHRYGIIKGLTFTGQTQRSVELMGVGRLIQLGAYRPTFSDSNQLQCFTTFNHVAADCARIGTRWQTGNAEDALQGSKTRHKGISITA